MRRLLPALASVAVLWLFLATDTGPAAPPDAPVCNQPPPDDLPTPSDRKTWAGVAVTAIHATNDWEGFDPELEVMRKVLGYTRYRGFRVLSRANRNLHVGEALTADVRGLDLRIELADADRETALLRAIVRRGDAKLLDTSIHVHWDKSFMVAGPKLDGGVLVAAITVR